MGLHFFSGWEIKEAITKAVIHELCLEKKKSPGSKMQQE
jgi:hypothetical protein